MDCFATRAVFTSLTTINARDLESGDEGNDPEGSPGTESDGSDDGLNPPGPASSSESDGEAANELQGAGTVGEDSESSNPLFCAVMSLYVMWCTPLYFITLF